MYLRLKTQMYLEPVIIACGGTGRIVYLYIVSKVKKENLKKLPLRHKMQMHLVPQLLLFVAVGRYGGGGGGGCCCYPCGGCHGCHGYLFVNN